MTSPGPGDRLDEAPGGPVAAVVALGANLGDRLGTLRSAVRSLAAADDVQVVATSAVFETDPVGPEQPDYLNAVVLLRTTLSPRALLAVCHRVEDGHGRVRTVRWGARTLDVDLLDHGGLVATSADLDLPHPRAAERAFVLVPWSDVDPDAVVPGADDPRRVADLLAGLPDAERAGVRATGLRLEVPA